MTSICDAHLSGPLSQPWPAVVAHLASPRSAPSCEYWVLSADERTAPPSIGRRCATTAGDDRVGGGDGATPLHRRAQPRFRSWRGPRDTEIRHTLPMNSVTTVRTTWAGIASRLLQWRNYEACHSTRIVNSSFLRVNGQSLNCVRKMGRKWPLPESRPTGMSASAVSSTVGVCKPFPSVIAYARKPIILRFFAIHNCP